MIKTLIALPYELARRPVVAVSDRLSGRLADDAGPRLALDQAISMVDQLAGTVLRNPDIARRGGERLERSRTLARAAELERQAEATREQARESERSAVRGAERKREAARERLSHGLEEADAVEARGKHEARTKAARTAASKKAAADRTAAEKNSATRRREDTVERAASTVEGAASKKAQAELDEAREDRETAAQARADAERLEELTQAKKAERRRS